MAGNRPSLIFILMIDNGFRYPFKTGTVKLRGTGIINFVDEGSGNHTLIFVHGLANYALGWQKNIDELRSHFRCIAIDLPGNGLSEAGDFPYSIQYFSDVVIDLVRHLKLQQVVLVGHSMGAQVAITAVLKEPALFSKLILCAPAGFERFSPMEMGLYQATLNFFDIFSTEENSLRKSLRSSFYHSSHQADGMVNDLVKLMHKQPLKEYRRMVEGCIHGMLHEPVFNSLHLIKVPTLVIFGERDALIPNKLMHPVTTRKIADEGAAQIPDADLHVLPQCGHFVQWEKARNVNELIKGFVAH